MSDNVELVLTRTLDAPRALVWKLWSEAVHLEQWWGPAGFGMKVAKMDFRVGGRFHYAMTPPGSELAMWGLFLYDEIHPEDRMVFRSGFADDQGSLTRNPFNAAWPVEIRNELTFSEQNGQTVLTMKGRPHNATPEEERVFRENRANVNQGFAGTFAQLNAYLEDALVADRAMFYRRTFDAPRDLVWRAWTEPTKIAAWFGPAGFRTTIHEMDVRPGGAWRFTMHGPDGIDYPNQVIYREVEPQRRLVYEQGHLNESDTFLVTAVFTERGDKTDVAYRMVFVSPEAKQYVIDHFGALKGLIENMDRFAAWLASHKE
jgi:uncharacterized protein YndB with AHSA1/START domain